MKIRFYPEIQRPETVPFEMFDDQVVFAIQLHRHLIRGRFVDVPMVQDELAVQVEAHPVVAGQDEFVFACGNVEFGFGEGCEAIGE